MRVSSRQRQTITLAPDESVILDTGAELCGVRIVQHAEATVPAIVAGDGASGSHHIRLRDVEITGGRPGVWAVQIHNPYEFIIDGLFIRTHGNGLLLEATNDHPYNPGDGEIRSLHIRLLSPGTTGVRVCGQQPALGGHYGGAARYPAHIVWSSLYVTAGDRPGWAGEGHTGMEIVNSPKHTLVGPVFEELATCLRLAGQVGEARGLRRSRSWAAGLRGRWRSARACLMWCWPGRALTRASAARGATASHCSGRT